MIAVLALLLATTEIRVATLGDARQAIAAGRIEQARIMVDAAVAKGTSGRDVEELLADIAYRSGSNADAAARYDILVAADPANALFAERAGIARLRLGDTANGARLLTQASRSQGASWRTWNALGVASDRARDWRSADSAYEHAFAMAPAEAAILNNRGWSQMLRGNWREAEAQLARAEALASANSRIRDNLALVRSAIAKGLPTRLANESDVAWASRLNDAGVAAMLLHDRPRAVAAFSQAISARDDWYQRAANNLAMADAAP